VSKIALCASILQETEDIAQEFVSSTIEEKDFSVLVPGEATRLPPGTHWIWGRAGARAGL